MTKKRRKPVPVIQVYFDDKTIEIKNQIAHLSRVTKLSQSEIAFRLIRQGVLQMQASVTKGQKAML